MNLSDLDSGINKFTRVVKKYDNGKFIKLKAIKDNNQTIDVIFSTEKSLIDPEFMAQLPENRYQIVTNNNGILRIIDVTNQQKVLELNLLHDDSFKNLNDLSFEWSNTGRFCFIRQVKSGKKILIDMDNKKKVDISLEGWFSIEWSDNDEMALVFVNKKKNVLDLNINRIVWNVYENTFQNISYSQEEGYQWSPDNRYLYSIGAVGGTQYKISRYSLTDKKWSDIYKTDNIIKLDSFKILNQNQIIFAETGTNKSVDPMTKFLKPQQDYIVKYDIAKNKENIKKLNSFLPTVFFWSFNNEYIYYQDYHGFFKAKVDF